MTLTQGDGYATIRVDATGDRRNIWWALVRREVSGALDLGRLREPGYALRVEARIRTSHAPRRVNLHLNTQKTVDFHTHLMEYDLPDTLGWHTISMTTEGFDAAPGDVVNAQLALMDWGPGIYRVDLDYYRVDVVRRAEAGPDRGGPMPYHPSVPDVNTFAHRIDVVHDAVLDLGHPDVNLNGWYVQEESGKVPVLAVGGTLLTVLRWDVSAFAGKRVEGPGLLELTTHSVQRAETGLEEFGIVRVMEILKGDPAWDQETVTLRTLTGGASLDEVFNPQMIIDVHLTEAPDGTTYATISRPVLQRLIDGKTRGIVLRPLGAVQAAFYALEHENGRLAPRLYFSTAGANP